LPRFILCRRILAARVSRPIECEPVAHEPFAKITVTDRTERHYALVTVNVNLLTANRPTRDKAIQRVRRLGTATILQAIVTTAKLVGLGCINTRQANALTMYLDSVAINDACLSRQGL